MKKLLFIIFILFNLISKGYSAPTEKLTVLLDWFANPNHAPLFVAKEQGFFQEQGLEVDFIGPADPSDPPKLVAVNKADMAITYQPQFIQQIDQNLPLICLGTLIDRPLNALVVLKNGPIKTISDLKGKRVGYSTGDVSSASLAVMLKTHHLSLKDIERINVHYDLTQALLSKKIDAVTGMMRNFELIQMELAGQPGRAFFPEENGIPTYSELIFVINKNNIHDARYKRFLVALKKGVAYLQEHPQETWEQFAKSHPELNDELNRRAWKETLSLFAKDPGKFDKKNWLTFANFMQKNGLIKEVESIETYIIKE